MRGTGAGVGRHTTRAGRAVALLLGALVGAHLACAPSEPARDRVGGLSLEEALAADWSDLETRVVTDMPADRTGGTAIVFLHGYGSRGDHHVRLARALLAEDVRVFLPTAALPYPKTDAEADGEGAGDGGAMWWEFIEGDWPKPWSEGPSADAWPEPSRQLPRARAAVLELVARIRREHRPDVVALAGHSQGAMLALDAALAAEPPVDRVAMIAGYVLLDTVPAITRARRERPRVFIAHGRDDALVGFDAALRASALLERNGFTVTFTPYDGGHRIDPAVVPVLRRFLVPPPGGDGGT